MKLNDYSYDEIREGSVFHFEKTITAEDVDNFAKLTGDINPLHMDESYAKSMKFKGRIAHGMLAGSLFSALVGMLCPGKKSLYLSQSLNFRKPIPVNSEVTVRGIVKEKTGSVRMIVISTEIVIGNEVAISGEAKVKVFGD